jgi:hypothetical protein
MMAILSRLDPSNPYPLPIPEPSTPVATTVEFVTVIDPAVETP